MFLDQQTGQQTERPRRRFQLAITLPDNGQLIGSCGIRRKPDNDWEADIGYELAPDFWGRGYATESARAMVNFGFHKLRLRRISSWCIADNAASVRVLERLGFRQEGRLRRNEYFKRRWWDTAALRSSPRRMAHHDPIPSHPLANRPQPCYLGGLGDASPNVTPSQTTGRQKPF